MTDDSLRRLNKTLRVLIRCDGLGNWTAVCLDHNITVIRRSIETVIEDMETEFDRLGDDIWNLPRADSAHMPYWRMAIGELVISRRRDPELNVPDYKVRLCN